MVHHACGRVVEQHALDALGGSVGAVAHDHHARVLRVAHAHAAAMKLDRRTATEPQRRPRRVLAGSYRAEGESRGALVENDVVSETGLCP